jgi:DNA polymerase-3 subunit delta'
VTLEWRPLGHERILAELRTHRRAPRRTYLFSGPDGVGRRVVARWFSALLNCAAEAAPCGECPSCRAMIAGTHADFRELAPATTTREGKPKRDPEYRVSWLVERGGEDTDPPPDGLPPARVWLTVAPRFRHRVLVLDRAGLLNESAANAMLKTLEEGSGRASVILVESDPGALLPTVASRGVPISFGLVDARDEALTRVHPAVREWVAGRPGLVRRALERAEEIATAAQWAAGVVEALPSGTAPVLERVMELTDLYQGPEPGFDPLWHLRRELAASALDPAAMAGTLAAVERAESAWLAYAHPGLTFTGLGLDLTETPGMVRDRPSAP